MLTASLGKAVAKKKVIILCWVGSLITKTYAVLFSTFWLLFILSYKGDTIEDDEAAQTIYQEVMIVSVLCGVAFVPLVGRFTDKVNPQITIPTAFAVRSSACFCFYFIEDPAGLYAYFVSIWLVLGTLMETVSIDALLLRNADREIRGVLYGI